MKLGLLLDYRNYDSNEHIVTALNMKYLVILALALTQLACDTYWRVQREMPMPVGQADCIRNAILTTDGVDGVIEMKEGKSYGTTFKELPAPVLFQFETSLSNGYVEYSNGQVSVYFTDHGTAPDKIVEQGPKYITAILSSIESNCDVASVEQNSTAG